MYSTWQLQFFQTIIFNHAILKPVEQSFYGFTEFQVVFS